MNKMKITVNHNGIHEFEITKDKITENIEDDHSIIEDSLISEILNGIKESLMSLDESKELIISVLLDKGFICWQYDNRTIYSLLEDTSVNHIMNYFNE